MPFLDGPWKKGLNENHPFQPFVYYRQCSWKAKYQMDMEEKDVSMMGVWYFTPWHTELVCVCPQDVHICHSQDNFAHRLWLRTNEPGKIKAVGKKLCRCHFHLKIKIPFFHTKCKKSKPGARKSNLVSNFNQKVSDRFLPNLAWSKSIKSGIQLMPKYQLVILNLSWCNMFLCKCNHHEHQGKKKWNCENILLKYIV